MLQRLLEQVRKGGSVEVRRLAEELGVSETLVRQMLEELERLGYVKRPKRCGLTPCSRCPSQTRCAQVWYVRNRNTSGAADERPMAT
ncbi:MAG TPA: winged helix-turn-helix transcriptional regulator [Methylothermaceae bacterium]|nr:winged helix-turn-helix transcriptional regulator [Methylothermaceae bacterium]